MKFLQNIVLLLACLLYAAVRGHARRSVPNLKKVCIIQVAQLGDMVCTTPMFHAVKETYPHAEVFVIGNALNEEVLRGNPDVDRYLIWKNNPLALIRSVRALRCDFGVTTSPNFVGLAILFLAGVSRIAVPRIEGGKTLLETRSYRLLRRLACVIPHTFDAYAPRQYLRLLEPIGIMSQDTHKHLYFSSEAATAAMHKLLGSSIKGRAFAVLAPGAGHPAKRWPPERFAAVAEYIAQHYMPVAVIGTHNDKKDVDAMFDHVTHPDIINFAGQLSIDELKAFISKASFFLSADTGPLYIAEAFGVPTIDIVGPASDTSQPPRGPKNIVLVPKRDKPAMTVFSTQGIDEVETKRQAEATQTEEVIEAVGVLVGSR